MKLASKVFLKDTKSDNVMIVTGGIVTKGTKRTEADVMKTLAVENGVPSDKIILEDQALNTVENILRVREILEKEGITNITLITSDYHMNRSIKLCQHLLGRWYKIDKAADHPNISDKERQKEEAVEKRMIEKMPERLKNYVQ
jgi:uncharacterized SAM-binding protein YcdF (DUF218 family)